jgi:hypothetical protein
MKIRRHDPFRRKAASVRSAKSQCLGTARSVASDGAESERRVTEWTHLCAQASDILNASVEKIDDLEYANMSLRARLVMRGFRELGLLPAAVRRLRKRASRARKLLPAARMAAIFLLVCAIAAHVSTAGA